MSAICGLCGEPATGLASIGDTRYCHGDYEGPITCYMQAQWLASDSARLMQAIFGADDTSDLDAARDDFEHDIAMNDPTDFERGN